MASLQKTVLYGLGAMARCWKKLSCVTEGRNEIKKSSFLSEIYLFVLIHFSAFRVFFNPKKTK